MNKFCFTILLFAGITANSQNFDSLKQEFDFNIQIESDSVLLMRKHKKFMAKATVISENKICLTRDLYDAEHYSSNAMCYELEGFQEDKFVPYAELENNYAMHVHYSGFYYSELSKKLTYQFNPFAHHTPSSNRIYRYRVFLQLHDTTFNRSDWKYVYLIRKKKQISEIKNMQKQVQTYLLRSQMADSLQCDSYLKKAQFYFDQHQYQNARYHCLKELEMDSSNGDAYLLLGLIYAGFANSLDDEYFPKRMIYCLSVDKFRKAIEVDPKAKDKAEKLIDIYSRYFPSGEVFMGEVKEGDKYKVAYWINEDTTIRFYNYTGN